MVISALFIAAALQQAATPPPPPPADKMICKRIVDTGSLVKGKKDCRTRAEWEKLAWAARQGTESFQGANMGRPPGQ